MYANSIDEDIDEDNDGGGGGGDESDIFGSNRKRFSPSTLISP